MDLGSDSLEIGDGAKIGLFCTGLSPNVAIALVVARIKDNNGIVLDLSSLNLIQHGVVFADENDTKFQLFQTTEFQNAKLSVGRREINIT